jgi:hypothetical protein
MSALLALIASAAFAQAGAEPPAPASEDEVQALREELARQEERTRAAEALAAQGAQRAALVERRLAALQQRGQAIESDRLQRVELYAQVVDSLWYAQLVLEGGSQDMAGELEFSERALSRCAEGALRFGGEEEAAGALQALDALAGARAALGQSDLYQARIQLVEGAEEANIAMSLAQASSQKLFRAPGP